MKNLNAVTSTHPAFDKAGTSADDPAQTRLSALFDGELDDDPGLASLIHAPDSARRWHDYALIGDALRAEPARSAAFMQRLSAALADEPTVLAPPRRSRTTPAYWLAAAASVAALSWALLGPVSQVTPAEPVSPTLAEAPRLAMADGNAGADRAALEVQDYLAAHQDYAHAVVSPADLHMTPIALAEVGR